MGARPMSAVVTPDSQSSNVFPVWRSRIVGYGEDAPENLLANPRNFRIHPGAQQDALAGVLGEVGVVQNVLVNRITGQMIDGHLRVTLAMRTGQPTIPVTYVDLSPEEEALVLASLDPIAAMAGTDSALLEALLDEIQTDNADVRRFLDDLRFEHVEFDARVGGLTDPDDVPDSPVEPITQLGDLWLLGEHRLLCGDATDDADAVYLMDGDLARMMWTDPPYGVNYVGKTKDALTIPNDDAAGLAALLRDAFRVATLALTKGAPFYIARPPGALSVTFGNAILNAGWRFHEELQWVKDVMVLGHSDYHIKHETICFGYLPGNGRRGRGGEGWYGSNNEVSVFEIDRPKRSTEHLTSKPIALITAHLQNSSRSGDLVLDLFGGSGSTLIACEQTQRRCAMMEIDSIYCDVIVRRWENFTGQTASRERREEVA